MTTKYYIDAQGNYLGGFEGSVPNDVNAVEIPNPPATALQKWTGDAFTASPMKNYQIYNYYDPTADATIFPYKIDYITGLNRRIYPKNTYVFGELRQTVYYDSRSGTALTGFTYATPVVQETFVYVRNPVTEFPISRTNTIQWYFTDGTLDTQAKVLTKYYDDDPVLVMDELVTRRGNNIDCIILSIFQLAYASDNNLIVNDIIVEGRAFFNLHSLDRQLYVMDGALGLADDVRNDTTLPWMDNDISRFSPFPTIRNFIIYQLTNGAQSS